MRIGLLRESGGLGDVIMTGGVVRRFPEDEVIFIGFEEYSQVVKHVGYSGAHYLSPEARTNRRNRMDVLRVDYPFISDIRDLELDRVFDLFCPGYAHEFVTRNRGERVKYSRVEAMQIQCGFYSDFEKPVWEVTEQEESIVPNWLKVRGIESVDKVVPIHYRATSPSRSYLDVKNLIESFNDAGYKVLLIDSSGQIERYKFSDNVILCWREALWLKAALLKYIGKLVCVDSGFYHLAAAIGIKTLSLWGPTDPLVTSKPYPDDTQLFSYSTNAEYKKPSLSPEGVECCNPPCTLPPKECNTTGCEWLNMISPEEILNKFENFV